MPYEDAETELRILKQLYAYKTGRWYGKVPSHIDDGTGVGVWRQTPEEVDITEEMLQEDAKKKEAIEKSEANTTEEKEAAKKAEKEAAKKAEKEAEEEARLTPGEDMDLWEGCMEFGEDEECMMEGQYENGEDELEKTSRRQQHSPSITMSFLEGDFLTEDDVNHTKVLAESTIAADSTTTNEVIMPTLIRGDDDADDTSSNKRKNLKRDNDVTSPHENKKFKRDDAGKNKPEKNDESPKRPMTALQLFKSEVIAATKRENPTAKKSEVNKLISQQWHALTKEQKRPYLNTHKQYNEKYMEEKKVYDQKQQQAAEEKRQTAETAVDAQMGMVRLID